MEGSAHLLDYAISKGAIHAFTKSLGTKTDMKRPAQPEELSPAYALPAAPACSGYITGIVLPVTGSVGSI